MLLQLHYQPPPAQQPAAVAVAVLDPGLSVLYVVCCQMQPAHPPLDLSLLLLLLLLLPEAWPPSYDASGLLCRLQDLQ
jgi:hypothetical protein